MLMLLMTILRGTFVALYLRRPCISCRGSCHCFFCRRPPWHCLGSVAGTICLKVCASSGYPPFWLLISEIIGNHGGCNRGAWKQLTRGRPNRSWIFTSLKHAASEAPYDIIHGNGPSRDMVMLFRYALKALEKLLPVPGSCCVYHFVMADACREVDLALGTQTSEEDLKEWGVSRRVCWNTYCLLWARAGFTRNFWRKRGAGRRWFLNQISADSEKVTLACSKSGSLIKGSEATSSICSSQVAWGRKFHNCKTYKIIQVKPAQGRWQTSSRK